MIPFGPDIWIAEGPVVSFYGFPYPTRMVAIRLANGELFVWSPIALDHARGIDAPGEVAHLVAPNLLHHLYLGEWKRRYPDARLYAAPGLARRRRDLAFDAELGDASEPAWAAEIDQVLMAGSFAMQEVVFFHRASRTAIFADLIENFPQGWFRGWKGVLARLDGIVAPHPGAPREWRWSFVNRRKARAALARIEAWDAARVVVAHGGVVEEGGGAFIHNAFRWLGP
ncbi:MAG TPA: DUF4336 domain-containing protein [Rhizomicrobium sp.]|nr:DUF4336 domain-containing protein [Rhizomicrobium sp.]